VPTKVLHGGHDGVGPAEQSEQHQRFFTGPYHRRLLPRIGHNVPQEAPIDFAAAILDLAKEHRP
jgi:pimeloyl-ACP methyl ester carboxylesterase